MASYVFKPAALELPESGQRSHARVH